MQRELDSCVRASDVDSLRQYTQFMKKELGNFVKCDDMYSRFNILQIDFNNKINVKASIK